MAKELFVSKSDELADGDRKIVPNGNYEIGVYRVNGELFDYIVQHQRLHEKAAIRIFQ